MTAGVFLDSPKKKDAERAVRAEVPRAGGVRNAGLRRAFFPAAF